MSRRQSKRHHYRRVAQHLAAAKRALVEAANVARAEDLPLTGSIEKAAAQVERLEEKFNRESGEQE
jgi:hypothetical protein